MNKRQRLQAAWELEGDAHIGAGRSTKPWMKVKCAKCYEWFDVERSIPYSPISELICTQCNYDNFSTVTDSLGISGKS